MQPNYNEKQRDDALCLGSLFHDGLEHWYKYRQPTIPEKSVIRNTPTPDAYQQAVNLVQGYVAAHPMELWDDEQLCTKQQWLEQPLTFPIDAYTQGLAKIDAYFYLEQPATIESGIGEMPLTLQPGWWIREYKTKAASISRAAFMQKWATNMQADFQHLALRRHVNEPLQGMIISVAEKPRITKPKRKCKKCGEMSEMASYTQGEGAYSLCPLCEFPQELSPYTPKGPLPSPSYFRFIISRTTEQLEVSSALIDNVAANMTTLRMCKNPQYWANREHCVDTRSRNWACPYFNAHTYNIPSSSLPELVQVADPLAYTRPTMEGVE